MVIDWDIGHPDFSPAKTSSLSGTQAQGINFAKTAQNLLKDFQVYPTMSWRGFVRQRKKSCDSAGSRFSSESAEQNVRFKRPKGRRPSDKPPPPCDCESCPLTNRVVGKVTPHPAATPGKGKSVPLRLLFLFVCLCVCREHAYLPKEDDPLSLSHERWRRDCV